MEFHIKKYIKERKIGKKVRVEENKTDERLSEL